MGEDGRPLVTKNSFRFLQTLYNLGPAPEPNMTVFWSPRLPEGVQGVLRQGVDRHVRGPVRVGRADPPPHGGDDAAIACCVSPMAVGKQMQFFGARVNLAKALLYAINGGKDEVTGTQVSPAFPPAVTPPGLPLDYDDVRARFDRTMDWLAETYVEALNCIHWSHDKYAYERLEMALHDKDVLRTMACGIAGLSVAADSLSAIRYATVIPPVVDERGIVVDYETEGDWPAYGNDDDRVDAIAVELVETFMAKIRSHRTYRDACPPSRC